MPSQSFSIACRAALLVLPLLAISCLPPERPLPPEVANAPKPVRVWERDTRAARSGVLVRLTGDSVAWRQAALTGTTQGLPLSAVTRVEVAERVSVRSAMKRGALKGALVGGALGAGLLAINPKAAGGAVGLSLGSAWLGMVLAGQQTESTDPPMRWRVVYPSR